MLYRLSVSPYLMGIRFFTCNQRLLSTVMSSQATVHQTTLTTMVQSIVVPTFRLGAATTPKNGPTHYNTQDITTVSNKMLCSSKAAHSILTTNCTYSNEFTNRSLDQGVFTSLQKGKLGLSHFPSFRLGEDLSQNKDVHFSNGSKSHLGVVASSNSLKQLSSIHKLRRWVWFAAKLSLRQSRDVYNKFWTFSESTKKRQVARIRHWRVGSGSKLTRGSYTHVGRRNWASIWVLRLVHDFPSVQTCGTPMSQ